MYKSLLILAATTAAASDLYSGQTCSGQSCLKEEFGFSTGNRLAGATSGKAVTLGQETAPLARQSCLRKEFGASEPRVRASLEGATDRSSKRSGLFETEQKIDTFVRQSCLNTEYTPSEGGDNIKLKGISSKHFLPTKDVREETVSTNYSAMDDRISKENNTGLHSLKEISEFEENFNEKLANGTVPADLSTKLKHNFFNYTLLHLLIINDMREKGPMNILMILDKLQTIFAIYNQKGISSHEPDKFYRYPLELLPSHINDKFPTAGDAIAFFDEAIRLTPPDDKNLDASIFGFWAHSLLDENDPSLSDYALKLIQERGLSLNRRLKHDHGMTALHLVVDNGATISTIKKLLKLGLDPASVDDWGNRPDNYAKDKDVKELLFKAYREAG